MTSSFALLALLASRILVQNSPAELERVAARLRSSSIQERDEASKLLRAKGEAALPALRSLLDDVDPEVRERARFLCRVIPIAALMPAAITRIIPDVEDRIARAGDREWTLVFLEILREREKDARYLAITREDLDRLAVRALRYADDSALQQVCEAVGHLRLFSARDGIAELLKKGGKSAQAAISAVRILKEDDATSLLLPLIADPWCGHAAMNPLVDLRLSKAADELRAYLSHADPVVRTAAARILGELGTVRDAKALLALLADTRPGCRSAGAESLGKLQYREAIPRLIGLLTDEDADVRSSAARALSDLNAADAMEPLLRLSDDREEGVRSAAAFALRRFSGAAVITKLKSLLEDSHPYVAYTASQSLGRIGAKQCISDLVKMLRCEHDLVVEGALEGLATLRASEAASSIVPLLGHRAVRVQYAAARALRSIHDGRDLTVELRKLLASDSQDSRANAAWTVGNLGVHGLVPELRKLLGEGTPVVRLRAAEALGTLRAAEATQDLRHACRDEYWGVRGEAATALAMMRAEAGVQDMIGILKVASEELPSVLQALESMGAVSATDTVANLLAHREPRVRTRAAAWLCGFGSCDGAALLLAESDDLTSLNGIRQQSLWEKLRNRQWSGMRILARKHLLEQIAAECGVKVEWSSRLIARDHRVLASQERELQSGITMLQALREAVVAADSPNELHYNFILEPDCIRVVSTEEAWTFWAAWLEKKMRK